MMNKKTLKKAGALFLSAALTVSVTASADNELELFVTYSSKDNCIILNGNGEGDLTVTVTEDGVTPENMSFDNRPLIFCQFYADGAFTETVGLDILTENGKYTVYLSDENGTVSDSFIYIDKEETEEIIRLLKKANKDEFEKLLSENAVKLGINPEDAVFSEKSDIIAGMLYGADFGDVTEFNRLYNLVYPLAAIHKSDAEGIKKILRGYDSVLGINYGKDFENEERLSEEEKKEVLKLLSSADFGRADRIDFPNEFLRIKALAAVKSSGSWLGLRKTITTDFADVFAKLLSNGKYKKIKDTDAVFEKMTGRSMEKFEDVEDNFNLAVSKVYEKENGSTSGGTGVSASAGGAVTTNKDIDKAPIIQPETKPEEKSMFPDVPLSHWGRNAIETLVKKSVIAGYDDGTFRPSESVTRAEFAKMIICVVEIKTEGDNRSFTDVTNEAWYYEYVMKAASAGIVTGYGTVFAPNDMVKREDAALMMYRLLEKTGRKPLGIKPFADRADISDYAKEAVLAMGGANYVSGDDSGRFLPNNMLSRAEAAQMIFNAFYK